MCFVGLATLPWKWFESCGGRGSAGWTLVVGPGHATALLANGENRIVGADADPHMLYAAHKRDDELELVAAHAESLPFASETLHGVVAISLTGCLAAPELCFSEICRVLRPNGTAVITFTNRASWLLRLNYRLPQRWVTSAAGGQSRHTYRLFVAAEVRPPVGAIRVYRPTPAILQLCVSYRPLAYSVA